MSRVTAFTDDALGTHDTVGLVESLQAREVSAAEVTRAAIDRVTAVSADLNPVACQAFDRALAEAASPAGGFFSGVPTFVKDNSDLAGLPTQDGCDAYVSARKSVDGDFARMFRATGLIPLGKSQLSEFGFSAVAEHPRLGAVRNPWDPSYTAGASSAGSAALVASGAVTLAHANDGGGSIRIPAACCGLVGLKPTRGRLAQDKMLREMPVRIVADGVLTRSVRDTAAFFREAETVYRNLKLPPIGDITRPGKARLKVALVVSSPLGDPSPEVAEATRAIGRLLEELGHQVEEVPPPVPSYFADDFLLYWSFLATAMVQGGRFAHRGSWDPGRLDNLTIGLDRHARRRAYKLPLAIARLTASSRVSRRFFRGYDVVLSPTLARATPQVGWLDPTQDFDTIMGRLLEWVAFTPLQNATGDPAISLPLATTGTGLPMGVMLGAGAGREATLLELAYELEEAVPFASIRG